MGIFSVKTHRLSDNKIKKSAQCYRCNLREKSGWGGELRHSNIGLKMTKNSPTVKKKRKYVKITLLNQPKNDKNVPKFENVDNVL